MALSDEEKRVLKSLETVKERMTAAALAEHYNDTDVMISLLEDALINSTTSWEAIRRSENLQRYAIALDLMEEKLIRGDLDTSGKGIPQFVGLHGITLKGREYLERLKRERRERGWTAKGRRLGLLALGAIGTVAFNWLKKHFDLE